MHVTVGLTNGEVHSSDSVTLEQLEQLVKEADGQIGTDYKTGRPIYVEDATEAWEWMKSMFGDIVTDKSLSKASLTLEINGVSRTYDATHIMWVEFVD